MTSGRVGPPVEAAAATRSGTAGGPVIPRYGESSLADLMPAVLAGMGVAGVGVAGVGVAGVGVAGVGVAGMAVTAGAPAIDLPERPRVCLLLVDGLGLDQLDEHRADAPFLSSLLDQAHPLTAGFPSTTATSLSSLGTGCAPGVHGLLGFEMFVPELGRPMNCLRWDPGIDPGVFQPLPTVFEAAAGAGMAVTRVGPSAFDGTGLTQASLRGGSYVGADYLGQRVAAAAAGLSAGARSLVYVYYGDLDATGHVAGCRSAAWRYQLAHADRLAEQLAGALPDDALLLVSSDHGMVDVPADARTDVATTRALRSGVAFVSGEPRAVYVHTVAGADSDVLAAWRETLGGGAWVVSREQACAEGWFGHSVTDHLLPRIGDVVVAARDPVAVVDSRTMAPELLSLVGYHGSLTSAEQLVPLLWWAPG